MNHGSDVIQIHYIAFKIQRHHAGFGKDNIALQKEKECAEAIGLKNAMENFEFVLMVVIQGKILETVNLVSKVLQNKDIDVLQATSMLHTASDCFVQMRDNFKKMKDQALTLAALFMLCLRIDEQGVPKSISLSFVKMRDSRMERNISK